MHYGAVVVWSVNTLTPLAIIIADPILFAQPSPAKTHASLQIIKLLVEAACGSLGMEDACVCDSL
jgi:hypothetical protein